jgi:hypothetical protein
MAATLGLLAIGPVLGCASLQSVPLSLDPTPMVVYVDGEPLEDGAPETVSLRTDRPHVLYFKREGYRPQQVVLESGTDATGELRLKPNRVEIRLAPIRSQGRQLEVELEPRDEGAGSR